MVLSLKQRETGHCFVVLLVECLEILQDLCAGQTCPAGECQIRGTCNAATGICSAPTNKANNVPCSIGSCQNGICTDLCAGKTCPAGECQIPGTCNAATGVCPAPTNKANNSPCSFTSLGSCQSGGCLLQGQLTSGWQNYGSEYADFQSWALPSGSTTLCAVTGLVKDGSYSSPIASIPCEPDSRLIFNQNNQNLVSRVDVLPGQTSVPTGSVQWSGGAANFGWVSLNTILFTPNPGNAINMLPPWGAYGNGYRGPSITITSSNLVVISGTIQSSGTWQNNIALSLPPPAGGRRVFEGNIQAASARVDLDASGNLLYVAGQGSTPWLSLSGITYFTGPVTYNPLSLSAGVIAAGAGLAAPGFFVRDGLCYVGGVVSQTALGQVGTLPGGCRPSGRVVFAGKCLQAGLGSLRVDILADGRIFTIAGSCIPGQFSLEGVIFRV